MALTVLSPVGGTAVEMSGVDDPVFAAGLVGPGVAIQPDAEAGREVVAPVEGTIVKLHPHAFVLQGTDGKAVLVHLGINTVQLEGEGFTLHAEQGETVAQGQVLITWDPAAIEAGGRSAVCPVVALEGSPDAVTTLAQIGATLTAGEALFSWA